MQAMSYKLQATSYKLQAGGQELRFDLKLGAAVEGFFEAGVVSEMLEGADHVEFHGALADVHAFGDFRVGEVFVEAEAEGRAAAVGEAVEALGEEGTDGVRGAVFFR